MVSAFLFQEKKAAELAPSSNSIRWNFGPSGTVVSFAEDVGLPSFFNSGPSRSVLFVTLNCVLVSWQCIPTINMLSETETFIFWILFTVSFS